jgi:hypothetical protein
MANSWQTHGIFSTKPRNHGIFQQNSPTFGCTRASKLCKNTPKAPLGSLGHCSPNYRPDLMGGAIKITQPGGDWAPPPLHHTKWQIKANSWHSHGKPMANSWHFSHKTTIFYPARDPQQQLL